ncbi:hypothetical protein Lepto7376_2516 [[Leptolyngbya] sp. PCC 7376]|uniref:hypothetical protein n=1 Tax=[Leptolyngbya] sp. PCC 7376 TaxID=111781 RepID=UPI00029F4755|nr:hypothetical protein [[Leptolyngbya] sp. PCC 7376]AFY38790.1 hypothetical protein Lepto7376_2516 [[Leptolyngbya] sp. PCC 7376]
MTSNTQGSVKLQAASCPIKWVAPKAETKLVAYWQKDREGKLCRYWAKQAIAH